MPNVREVSALSSNLGGYWGDTKTSSGDQDTKTSGDGADNTQSKPTQIYARKSRKEIGIHGSPERVFLPKTELGDKVDEYLYWFLCGMDEEVIYSKTGELQEEIRKLIETGGEDVVAPFFEHLDTSYIGSLTFFGGGDAFSIMMLTSTGLKNERGSAVHQMKSNSSLWRPFKWLIKQLETKKPN
mmetsp:Transcript_14729/g.31993  ORF Transcript_14729/g.31993 Transcript_14729/m.31993 type:complete len:184 (+) Transcript_14729:582-1133(+)|eukprot:CAMPEP_0172316910 /NCGR_PEP_ID=MMETSP1058-20130122/29966_1 /TAXON_ID=83371 /ORGANISM="Detonula confervacea, Strain CCMP 353" /LENGTH=183 /DNA_ID=CAMNT_0013031347 /DNA_START=511 /DNA_END=1062 /DNA_ORIENTATION=-